MPNHKLPPHLKRDRYIKVSVNESEWATIEAAKSQRKCAAWLREAVLWSATQNVPTPDPVRRAPEPSEMQKAIWIEMAALRTQLSGIGRNVNQLAHRANSGERLSVLQALIGIDRDVNEIKKLLQVILMKSAEYD